MRWMIWEGANDYIFPAELTLTTYRNIFNKLGASDTLKVMHTEPGMSHWMAQSEFTQMKEFMNGNDFDGSLQNLNGWDDFVNGVKGFGKKIGNLFKKKDEPKKEEKPAPKPEAKKPTPKPSPPPAARAQP